MSIRSSRTILVRVFLILLAGAGSIGAVHQALNSTTSPAKLSVMPKMSTISVPTQTPNPLSIATVRAHVLTPSPVTTTQQLSPRGGCTTSVVSFTSDGLTQYSLLQIPATAAPSGGYPVVILAHGYIDPKTYQTTGTDYQGFINSFCGSGYAVFKLDYRGNGASAGTPSGGDIAVDYTYDLLNLTASIKNIPTLNSSKIAWLGHSMGGAVVLRAAVASHDLPVKAIVLASSVVGSADDTLNNWPTNELPADLIPQKAAITTKYGTPATNPAFWHDVSAINYVSKITAPVEINHGTADTVVPLLFSQHLDSALTTTNLPHVFYTYPGGDHQYSTAGSGASFLTNTTAFLAKYVK